MNISFECDLTWKDLNGNSNTKRYCERCNHSVYNLSGMTKEQAQRVVRLHEGEKLCVRFINREGRIVHDGDPYEQLRTQQRGANRLVAVALIAQAGFLALADEPSSSFFDPFAAVASSITGFFDLVDQKFEDANQSVTMGMVEF